MIKKTYRKKKIYLGLQFQRVSVYNNNYRQHVSRQVGMTLECSIEFKSWSTSPKKKELIWNDPVFLKPQIRTHWHTSINKATLPNLSPSVHQLEAYILIQTTQIPCHFPLSVFPCLLTLLWSYLYSLSKKEVIQCNF